MSDHGSHPTVYGRLSDTELFAHYRGETWSGLDEDHRQQLLQETVNRVARLSGEKGSCRVVFADLGPRTDAEQSGGEIRMSRSFASDERLTARNGELVTETDPCNNMKALTAVLHEDRHAWQNQVIDGTIRVQGSDRQRVFAANDFNPVSVAAQDGTEKPGLAYIQGRDDEYGYLLYYLQPTELDAHAYSEALAKGIMEDLEKEYGTEPSFGAFRQELAANGSEAVLRDARELFGNETVAKDVRQSLMNRVYGTNAPVDPQVDRLVGTELTSTWASVRGETGLQKPAEAESKGGSPMVDWSGMKVTEEQYDATLRGSVNAYYEHAKADPNMSEEDAIRSTGEMAERYEEAMEDFRAEAAEHEAAEGTGAGETGPAEEGGVGTEEGGVGGDDGGIGDDDGGIE